MGRIYDMQGYSNYVETSDLANLFDVDVVEDRNGVACKFYNLGRTVIINGADSQSQPLTYKVCDGDTWLGISYQLYGDVRYWWVLAKLNGCVDATKDPAVGTDIYVLTQDNVVKLTDSLRDEEN